MTRTVYVTKYALSVGILVKEMEPSEGEVFTHGVYVYTKEGGYMMQCRLGYNAFLTQEEAMTAAEAMRRKKMASLDKQIAKIKRLVIRVVDHE